MKIVRTILVKMERYVWIQKKVLPVYVHHGRMTAHDVNLWKKYYRILGLFAIDL